MKMISEEAAIKRTTLYDYFKSKDAILFELIESMFEENPLKCIEGTYLEQLESLARQMFERIVNHLELTRLMFESRSTLDKVFREK